MILRRRKRPRLMDAKSGWLFVMMLRDVIGIWWKWEMVGGPWWLSTRLHQKRLPPDHTSAARLPDFRPFPNRNAVCSHHPDGQKNRKAQGTSPIKSPKSTLWSKKQQERLKSAVCKDSLTSTAHAGLTSAPRVTIQFSHYATRLQREESVNVQPCMLALGASPNASSSSHY